MVQGYYDLNEAAQVLGVTPEELKQLAQRNQIRSFQDRGTWRFRVQDVQELARQRGLGSDADLVLGDASRPKATDSPAPRSPAKGQAPDVFDFPLEFDAVDDKVDIGREILGGGSKPASKAGSKKGDSKKGDSKKPGSKSPQPKTPSHRTPKAGSDSDVRLVSEGSNLEFAVGGAGDVRGLPGSDSDVKLVHDSDVSLSHQPGVLPSTPKVARKSGLAAPKSPTPKKSKVDAPAPDSGVRLVPIDSDSDVKIIGAGSDEIALGAPPPKSDTDSDVRLERAARPPSSDEAMMLTEEINLDEELKKQEAARKHKPQAKVKPKSKIPKQSPSDTSPFELSDLGLAEPSSAPGASSSLSDSSDVNLAPKPDSSDFDLTTGAPSSPLDEASDSSEDFSLELPDDSDPSLEASSSSSLELKGPSSGIALNKPKDQGISLEGGPEESLEFELSLDAAATPKPAPEGHVPDSSEFELSLDLDDSSSGNQPVLESSPAESSEFELTLDDSGNLAPMEEDSPQLKAGEEKDIFETDFEVPNLEDESGSQVAALETDLDSSDFDLALGDSEIAVEDESGSQVVALDEEEEADDAAATVAAKRKPTKAKKKAGDDEEELDIEEEGDDFGELSEIDQEEPADDVEEDEEAAAGPVKEVVREKLVTAPPWGPMPVIFMLPCVVVLFLVGIMGFEMVQSMAGFKPAGFITKTFTELIEGKKAK